MTENATATGKILIVDDDEGVTQTFARMLQLEGYQVRTAVSAETGLAEAARNELRVLGAEIDDQHFVHGVG